MIGVGFDLDRHDALAAIEAIGSDYADVREGRTSLTDAQIDALFDADVRQAVSTARARTSRFDELPIDERRGQVDLAFALCDAEFTRFRRLVDAVEGGTWEREATSAANGDREERELFAADEDS
jgi:hypothetical protein